MLPAGNGRQKNEPLRCGRSKTRLTVLSFCATLIVSNETKTVREMRKQTDDSQTLLQTPLFAGTDAATLQQILSCAGVSRSAFAKGEAIYTPEHFSNRIGILLEGAAIVEKRCEESRMLMSILKTGDIFGAATLFLQRDDAYMVSIRAVESVRALFIEEDALLGVMRQHFSIAENYMRYLTTRVRFLNQRIEGFVQPTVEDRLLLFLQHNAVAGVCTLPFGMSALADALCVSRATLYRALEALERDGRISRENRTIRLHCQ